jgi:hypothetical protein
MGRAFAPAGRGERVTTSYIFVRTPELEIMGIAGVAAAHSTPIVGSSGRLWGVFTVHFAIRSRPIDMIRRRLIGLLPSLPISWNGPTSARRRLEKTSIKEHPRQNWLVANRAVFQGSASRSDP